MSRFSENLKHIISVLLIVFFCVPNAKGQFYYLNNGEVINFSKNEEGDTKLFESPKWKFTTNPNVVNKPYLNSEGNWKEGPILDVIDSLIKEPDWNNYIYTSLNFRVKKGFEEKIWWIKVFTLSPIEVYINGRLIATNGKPSLQKESEKTPSFTKSKPLFNEIGTLAPDQDHIITIKWSSHQAVKLTRILPGTFKENGPIITLTSVNPWPKFTNELGNIYARVYISCGLLILVIIIQIYFFILLKRKINLVIAVVALLLLLHLFLSHNKFINYSILNVALDSVLFYPLFISIFSLFPWIASKLLNVRLGLSNRSVLNYIVFTVLLGIGIFAFFGKNNTVSFVFLFLTLIHSFIWLVIITYKSHSQKAQYATLIILAYFLPISIIIFSFLYEIITKFFNLGLPDILNSPIFSNILIITFYISLPVLTTIHIARQNTDLLNNLSRQVEERTHELKLSLENFKAAQVQLVQSEKMASLGELTAGIAHEIQNPLNFVNNFSELNVELISELVEEVEKGSTTEVKMIADDIKANSEKIHHHGKRADAIVKSMLAHSRSSAGKKEWTNLNALAEEYLKLAYHGIKAKKNQFNANFSFIPDSHLPLINIVPQEIGRVLLNLLNNAFYAVNERSKQGEPGYTPEVILKTAIAGRYVQISVHDNGGGIPESIREKIFQPFFTTKPTGEGTGLGLSLSYDIITKGHQGLIDLKTEETAGTTIIISLPV